MKLFSQDAQLMTEGSIAQHIVRFAIPLLIGNMLQQTYQLADMIIVGRCIDDDGLSIAAVGMSGSFIMLMIGFFVGLATGAGVVISNAYGAGQTKRVKKAIRIALILAACVSVTVCILSRLGCSWLLEKFHTTEDIFDLSELYLRTFALGFVPLLIYNMGTSILQALGNSTSPFYYLSVTCVLNVILDLVFMLGFDAGVGGAAWATVISQVLAMCLVLRKINKIDIGGNNSVYNLYESEPDGKQILMRMLRLSLPISLQSVASSFSNLILQGQINLLGTSVIAAWGIFGRIDGFLLLPVQSFSIAITTFAGQNLGAGRLERIAEGKNCVAKMSSCVTIVLSVIFLILCEPIVLIFEDNPEIVNATREMCFFMLPFYFLIALFRTYSGLLNGMGKAIYSSVVMISCLCVLRVVVIAFIFPVFQSAMAVYISYYASWISALILFVVSYRSVGKKMGIY